MMYNNGILINFNLDGGDLNPIFNVPEENDRVNNFNKNKLTLHPLYKTPIKKILGVGLSLEMIKQIENENALISFDKYQNNILLLFGDNDSLTEEIRYYLMKHDLCYKKKVDFNIIEEADHLFNKSIFINQVFKISMDWIINNYSKRGDI